METPPARLPASVLIAVYCIVPVALLVIALDHFVLGGQLKAILPRTPDNLFLYGLVFVFPHIVASVFTFADSEYLAHYRRQLLLDLPLLCAIFLLIYFADGWLAFALYILYTEYHQVSQQGGMGRFFFAARLPEYNAWRYLAIALATIGYGVIYHGSLFLVSAYALTTYILGLALVLFVPFAVLTYRMYRQIPSTTGRVYLLVVSGGFFGALPIILAGYPIFAILCSRFVHDVPAFLAYMVHDHNRQVETRRNWIYRVLAYSRVPVYVLVPVFAIVFAYFLVRAPFVSGAFLFTLAMAHYYIEGFIWKSGSPHRRYLLFGT